MHLTLTRKYYTRVGIQGKIQLLWLALSVFWFWQVYKLMLFLLDRCYEQFVLIQCCMIVRVLFLLICDTRHSDLAHQGMIFFPPEAHLLHFFLPTVNLPSSWSFFLTSHHGAVLDVVRQSLTSVRWSFNQRTRQGTNSWLFFSALFSFVLRLFFLKMFLIHVNAYPIHLQPLPPLVNSLNCVLFGSSFLSSFHLVFCFFPPWVWFPFFQRRFQFCFLQQQVSLFSFFFFERILSLSITHAHTHIHTHTIWFRGLRLHWVVFFATRWHFLVLSLGREAVDRRIGNSSQGGIPLPCSIVILK